MTSIRLACEAMATRFELVLRGADPVALRSAGEEALEEIQRIERLLSLYRPDSAIAALNREAASRPVRTTPEVVALLRHAILLSQATGEAFDVTVGPLLRVWDLVRGGGRVPSDAEVDLARESVGSHFLELDEGRSTVRFTRPGVRVDLGSIGKGYALDRAAGLLRDAGVEHALLHGGTSTALAWGRPSEAGDGDLRAAPGCSPGHGHGSGAEWRVAIEPPPANQDLAAGPDPGPLAVIGLREESLSVSAVWGKGFREGGRYYGHVMDPRLGRPVQGALLSAIVLPSATETDALSTALLVRGSEMLERLRGGGPVLRGLVLERDPSPPGWKAVFLGLEPGARGLGDRPI